MKKILFFLIFSSLFAFCSSCNHAPEKTAITNISKTTDVPQIESPKVESPIMAPIDIVKSFGIFWTYFNNYALLHQELPAADENGKSIDKGLFLEKLNTGLYLPLVMNGKNGEHTFKLAPIPKNAPGDISLIIMNYANRELVNYRMEGKPVPKFNFTDINGKVYTSENTKGKIVLFKCWFISCVPCVQEMPALNKLVQKYQDRKDILFISLALDKKQPLQKFLTTTKFDYATIPNQKDYLEQKLHVQSYPSHFIINKRGLLVKSPPDEAELEKYLEKEIAKDTEQ